MHVFVYVVAPAPIFAVKKPRQALIAHPNNYPYNSAQAHHAGVFIMGRSFIAIHHLNHALIIV